MQASMEQLLNELGLLIPLVDLVEEGLQNILNSLVWLGLDVSNQFVVPLTLVLTARNTSWTHTIVKRTTLANKICMQK